MQTNQVGENGSCAAADSQSQTQTQPEPFPLCLERPHRLSAEGAQVAALIEGLRELADAHEEQHRLLVSHLSDLADPPDSDALGDEIADDLTFGQLLESLGKSRLLRSSSHTLAGLGELHQSVGSGPVKQ